MNISYNLLHFAGGRGGRSLFSCHDSTKRLPFSGHVHSAEILPGVIPQGIQWRIWSSNLRQPGAPFGGEAMCVCVWLLGSLFQTPVVWVSYTRDEIL